MGYGPTKKPENTIKKILSESKQKNKNLIKKLKANT